MFTAQARIPTGRAGRYLAQLRDHSGRMASLAEHRPDLHAGVATTVPQPVDAQHADTEGVIDFGWARCTLAATDAMLILRGEAEEPEQLRRLQEGMARTLERIGHRDGLTVVWEPAFDDAAPQNQPEPRAAAEILEFLLTPEGRADPYPLYSELHRLGPVSSPADGYFLVAGYEAVNQVLRDPGFGLPDPAPEPGSDQAGGVSDALRSMSRSILRANPPDHGRMRSLISQVFTPRRVATLKPAIEAAADRLIEEFVELGAGGRTTDFMDAFAFPLPVTVMCELLGVREGDRARFRPLAADLTEALELSADLSGAADAAARELSTYFAALVAERREHPADDLIGALVAVRDAEDDRLSEQELLANLILLLVAGFETTTSLLGNGLALFLADPALAAAVRSGEVSAEAFVEEVLRFDSPVQVTTRVARADGLSVAGIAVPRGAQAVLLIGAANRDPDRYPDPDGFDLARSDIRPLSFGAGPHICLGNSLSRLEASVAFPRILERLPGMSADPEHRPVRRDRLVLRGYQTLPVRLPRS